MIRLSLLAALLALSGCGSFWWFEWRDEPYVRPVVRAGETVATRDLGSLLSANRAIASRALGELARDARRRGDHREAQRLARLLMEHFAAEPSREVQSVIVALALRDAWGGPGDEEIAAFLFRTLEEGDQPIAAGYSIATLGLEGAYGALRDAAMRSPYEKRYELLQALWLLGDPRAASLFRMELRRVDEEWPERIHHMPRAQYRQSMEGRLRSLEDRSGQ